MRISDWSSDVCSSDLVNIEKRVERARELAREQTDNDFARRMALITESLNSNAIDLTRILSSEVSDTSWTAYLKGDRGIFTRRAVRLLETGEMREISRSEEHTSELQSLMRISSAGFCLKKKKT